MSVNPTIVGSRPVSGIPESFNAAAAFNAFPPEMLPVLFNKVGMKNRRNAYMTLSEFVPKTEVGNTAQRWKERAPYDTTMIVLGASSAGAAGAPVTVTLAPSSLGVNNLLYAQVGNGGNFKNDCTYTISAVSGVGTSTPTVTLQPSPTGIVPAFANLEVIAVTDFAGSEGSGQPKPYFQGDFEYVTSLQFLKDTQQITGTMEMANAYSKVDNEGNDLTGKKRIQLDGLYTMTSMVGNSVCFNEGVDVSMTGDPQQFKLQGLKPALTSTAGSRDFVAPGAFTFDLYSKINDDMDLWDAGVEFVQLNGSTRHGEIMKAASSAYSSNAAVWVTDAGSYDNAWRSKFDGAAQPIQTEAKKITTNIKTFNDGRRTMHFAAMPVWSDPYGNNPAGYTNNNLVMGIPMDAGIVDSSRTTTSMVQHKFMRKPGASGNGMMKFWELDANAAVPTSDKDVRTLNWSMHLGQVIACTERFYVMYC